MTKLAYVYQPTEHAYGEIALRPEHHARRRQGDPSWEIANETFHSRGVTVIWRTLLWLEANE